MKKFVLMQQQMILTSKHCAEHPFAGGNTQHPFDRLKFIKQVVETTKNPKNCKSKQSFFPSKNAARFHLMSSIVGNIRLGT